MKNIILIFCIFIILSCSRDWSNPLSPDGNNNNPVPTDGLVASYSFSGNANDESGNNNHGTLYGNASTNRVLSVGNNITDYLSIPHTVITGLTIFSISARLKIDVLHTTGTNPLNTWISGARTTVANAFVLFYWNATNWIVSINNSRPEFNQDKILKDMNWHHVVFIRNGSIARIFIDNDEIGSGISVGTTPIDLSPSGLLIGQDQDTYGGSFSADNSWAGKIDNLRFYNRVLTADEIKALFNETGWGE